MPHTYTVSSSVFSFEEVFYHPYECRLFSHKINMVGKPIQWNLLTSANLRRSVSQCSNITHYHYGCMEVTQHWQAYNQKGDNPKWSNMLLIVNFLWKHTKPMETDNKRRIWLCKCRMLHITSSSSNKETDKTEVVFRSLLSRDYGED